MTPPELFLRFGIALANGFMIGLQRRDAFQTARRELVAGERTLALMDIFDILGYFLVALVGQVGLTILPNQGLLPEPRV